LLHSIVSEVLWRQDTGTVVPVVDKKGSDVLRTRGILLGVVWALGGICALGNEGRCTCSVALASEVSFLERSRPKAWLPRMTAFGSSLNRSNPSLAL